VRSGEQPLELAEIWPELAESLPNLPELPSDSDEDLDESDAEEKNEEGKTEAEMRERHARDNCGDLKNLDAAMYRAVCPSHARAHNSKVHDAKGLRAKGPNAKGLNVKGINAKGPNTNEPDVNEPDAGLTCLEHFEQVQDLLDRIDERENEISALQQTLMGLLDTYKALWPGDSDDEKRKSRASQRRVGKKSQLLDPSSEQFEYLAVLTEGGSIHAMAEDNGCETADEKWAFEKDTLNDAIATTRSALDLLTRELSLQGDRKEFDALEEIRREQTSCNPIIEPEAFARLVKEIIEDLPHSRSHDALPVFPIEPEAIEALQCAAEDFLVNRFEVANILAIHAQRTMIEPGDMQLAGKLSAMLAPTR
jgi:histone H3/H4